MPLLYQVENFAEDDISVLWTAEGLRSPRHVDIDTSLYTVQKTFPPGMFVGTIAASDKVRLLPAAVVTAGTTTSQAVVTVAPSIVGVFVVGDVLTVITASTGAAGGAVGTIQSINYTTGAITLAANSSTALTANTTIVGIATSIPVGMISPNTTVDFSMNPVPQYGAFVSASVVRARMPYWAAYLKTAYFPEIVTKEAV